MVAAPARSTLAYVAEICNHFSTFATVRPTGRARFQVPGIVTHVSTGEGMRPRAATGWALLFALSLAAPGCGVPVSDSNPGDSEAELESLDVGTSLDEIPVATDVQLTATGQYSDGSSADLTEQVDWSSSDEAVAAVSADGLLAALSAGEVTVTAREPDSGISGLAGLVVTSALLEGIEIQAEAASLPLGREITVTALGRFSDGHEEDVSHAVEWAVDDPAVATVSGAGELHAVGLGETTLTASVPAQGLSASLGISVTDAVLDSLEIEADGGPLPLGLERQLTAVGTYSDGTTEDLSGEVIWESDSGEVAAVSETGLLSSFAMGSAGITAYHEVSGLEAELAIEVSEAVLMSLSIGPDPLNVYEGEEQPLTATGLFSDDSEEDLTDSVGWSLDDGDLATLSQAGVLQALGGGTVEVTATDPDTGISASLTVTLLALELVSIAVTPAAFNVPLGLTLQLTATGTYNSGATENLTAEVVWDSLDDAVATVDAGLVTAVAIDIDPVTITATKGVISGQATITVVDAVLMSITVTPNPAFVAWPLGQQFTANGSYSDLTVTDITNSVTWTSSNEGVATINSTGFASWAGQGVTTITATKDGVSGTSTLTTGPAP
jgi:hypothetical protein